MLQAKTSSGQTLYNLLDEFDLDGLMDFFIDKEVTEEKEYEAILLEWRDLGLKVKNEEEFKEKSQCKGRPYFYRRLSYTINFILGKLDKKSAQPSGSDETKYKIAKKHGVEWSQKFCRFLLENAMWERNLIRFFVLDGTIDRPESDEYYMGLMRGGTKETVLENEDIREHDIWKLFEVEGNRDLSMANCSKWGKDSWGTIFMELSEEGIISRARILRASLAALTRDFIQFRAGWYSRFHVSMEPNDKEIIVNKDLYLKLCNSIINPTVTFTSKFLLKLQKNNFLSTEEIIDYFAPLILNKSNAASKNGIKMCDNHMKKEPGSTEEIALLLISGLSHESNTIQEIILKTLNRYDVWRYPSTLKEITQYIELIPASLKNQLPLFDECETIPVLDSSESITLANEIPKIWQEKLDIPQIIKALNFELSYSSSIDFKKCNLSDLIEDFQPLMSLEELVECCQHVLENFHDMIARERCLEALSRFGCDRPDNFDLLTGPLKKRLKRSVHDRAQDFESILQNWLNGSEQIEKHESYFEEELTELLDDYYFEFSKRLIKKKPFNVLSTPTHSLVIDPLVLADRIENNKDIHDLDFCLSLMRLSKVNRSEALKVLSDRKDQASKILAYALGDEVRIKHKLINAACNINRSDQVLLEVGVELERTEYGHINAEAVLKINNNLKKYIDVTIAPQSEYYDISESSHHILHTFFQNHREFYHYQLANYFINTYSWVGSNPERWIRFDEINQPNIVLDNVGVLMIVSGLFIKDNYTRALSADLLIEAISDGRLDEEMLSNSINLYTESGLGICKRLAQGFKEAISSGPLHKKIIRDTILLLIPRVKEIPRDFAVLLEILQDLLVESGLSLNTECEEKLKTLTGKALKIFKAIDKIEDNPDVLKKFNKAVTLSSLELRINRYSEWCN